MKFPRSHRPGLHRSAARPRNLALSPRLEGRRFRLPPRTGRVAGWLHRLARLQGIAPSYRDMEGRLQTASPECLRALLRALGIPTDKPRQPGEQLRELERAAWRRMLAPVNVAWDGRATSITIRSPAGQTRDSVSFKLHLEDGGCRSVDWEPDRWPLIGHAEIEGRRFVEHRVRMPPLPPGYHRLELEVRGRNHQSLLISAPSQTYSPPEPEKSWGLFLPMYALHSLRSWGAGSLADYQRLSRWAGIQGSKIIGSLPVLAAFLDSAGYEPSPYSPASRLFWNEFYIDIPGVPEFAGCAPAQKLVTSGRFQGQLANFRAARFVNYPTEMAARRSVLELLAKQFFRSKTRRHRVFELFLEQNPLALDYAEFRATRERQRVGWPQWSERARHGKLQTSDYSPFVRNYYLYCQWIAEEQFAGFSRSCRERDSSFHLDLPLGVHPESYDSWRMNGAFATSMTVGAPPDLFFSKGQNWGFPPPHPRQMRESGYAYFLDCLRFQMRHASLLRIDHVMGLHRLFWIPEGLTAREGTYVEYPAEEIYALLCLESQRHQTMIVGENLGTVPPEVTQAMRRHGLRETYAAQFSQSESKTRPVRMPRRKSIAMLNTHDMPTFGAHWKGADVRLRAAQGQLTSRESAKLLVHRHQQNRVLLRFLHRRGWLDTRISEAPDVAKSLLAWLAASPADAVLINLEDLWGEEEPQNQPGLVKAENWSRKSRLSLEEIVSSRALRMFLRRITELRGGARTGKPSAEGTEAGLSPGPDQGFDG
jgi:4-alpha-glucanotransferase